MRVPCYRIQHLWNQQPSLQRESYSDTVEALPRIWISAIPAVLQEYVVHGRVGCCVHYHYNHGHRHTLRQEQEL